MTYRIQADLSFINKQDADDFIASIKSLGDKIYYPTLEETTDRSDLWTYNRLTLIRDYDDEGNNKPGVGDLTRDIIKPVDLEKSISHEEKIVEKIVYVDKVALTKEL